MQHTYDDEIIVIHSSRSAVATANGIEKLLSENGFKVFLRLDQQSVARKVGLMMRSTQVIVFGKPEIGTQLMNQYPSIAVELPLKLVVQEEQLHSATITMLSPQAIAKRHGIERPIFRGLVELLRQAAEDNFISSNYLQDEIAVN